MAVPAAAAAGAGLAVTRSPLAIAIANPAVSTSNFTRTGNGNGAASLHRVCRPSFFGSTIASTASDTKSQPRWTNKSTGLIRVQLKDNGFEDQPKNYLPEAEFFKVEAVLRPWRLSPVSSALLKMGIRGVTVTDVRGFGAQGGSRERQAGTEFADDNFLQKVKLEIVVSKDQVEAVIDIIIDQARTGEIGDGKIFVLPVADIIRIRTGERGLLAERMAGGRAAMQVSVEGSHGN